LAMSLATEGFSAMISVLGVPTTVDLDAVLVVALATREPKLSTD
jgi:hypothetical protein